MEEDRNRQTGGKRRNVEEAAKETTSEAGQPLHPDFAGKEIVFNADKAHKAIDLGFSKMKEHSTKGEEFINMLHSIIDLLAQTPMLVYAIKICDETPIDMILHCPKCHKQHVDAPDGDFHWKNPPHRSHLCHSCGNVWRPADVNTNGVQSIKTKGKNDTPQRRSED